MNAITPFVFENEHMIRTIDRDGEPWFVLADVCRVLELSNPAMAAKPLDEDEKAKLNLGFGARGSDATIISESGLYALILRCRGAMTPGTLPHRFRRWVTHEVLPTLRKTGRYDMGGPTSPDAMAADMLPRVSIVREYRMLRGKAAAYALWQRLDLPEAHAPVMADMPDAHAHDLEHYGHPRFPRRMHRGPRAQPRAVGGSVCRLQGMARRAGRRGPRKLHPLWASAGRGGAEQGDAGLCLLHGAASGRQPHCHDRSRVMLLTPGTCHLQDDIKTRLK